MPVRDGDVRDIAANGDGDVQEDVNPNGDGQMQEDIYANVDGKVQEDIDGNHDGEVQEIIDANGDGDEQEDVNANGDGQMQEDIYANVDGKAQEDIDADLDGKVQEDIDANLDRDEGAGMVEAREAGLEGLLRRLLARPDIQSTGVSAAVALAALQESGGLLHPARRLLLASAFVHSGVVGNGERDSVADKDGAHDAMLQLNQLQEEAGQAWRPDRPGARGGRTGLVQEEAGQAWRPDRPGARGGRTGLEAWRLVPTMAALTPAWMVAWTSAGARTSTWTSARARLWAGVSAWASTWMLAWS